MTQKPKPSVIVFGETGVGKSSVLNMLGGGNMADVSSKANGVTFSSTCYDKTINGSTFKIYDTVGLNEGSAGTVDARDAIDKLFRLIRHLEDGVNLLIYVMRAPRITRTAQQNYEMFFDVFCCGKVPIAMVVTGLEEEDDMDRWWKDNKSIFDRYKMSFRDVACITATKGKLRDGVHIYEDEYQESKEKLENLIQFSHNPTPWKMPTTSWFVSAAVGLYNVCAKLFGVERLLFASELRRALMLYAGLSDKDAAAKAQRIESAATKSIGRPLVPNVIVFGETGTGKSSVVNMLDGGTKAAVSSSAKGVTFSSTCYEKTIFGSTYRVFDTVGLNEGTAGTVAAKDAIKELYNLICQLNDGVNLLVYVMRAPRVTQTAQQNYEMFFDVFCHKMVPIVMVVTGLEEEQDMDRWWEVNKAAFDQYKMAFSGVSCITATKGKLRKGTHLYQTEYDESKAKLDQLVRRWHNPTPWKMPAKSWFISTMTRLYNVCATLLGFQPHLLAIELHRALKYYAGLSDREATDEARKIDRSFKAESGAKSSAHRIPVH
jgi:predicted GTPase